MKNMHTNLRDFYLHGDIEHAGDGTIVHKDYICLGSKKSNNVRARVYDKVKEVIHKRRAADAAAEDCYFFLAKNRKPMTTSTISTLMNRLKKRTGIYRLHAHLFRHTFATNFLVHGLGDVYELSRILGHSEMRVTDQYLQLASYYTIIEKRRKLTYLDMKK